MVVVVIDRASGDVCDCAVAGGDGGDILFLVVGWWW